MRKSRTGDFSRCTHGIRSTYVYGCRCEECTEAHRVYCAQRRWSGVLADKPDDPRHGTPSGYTNYGCRCLACRQAYVPINAATKAQIRARANG